MVPLFFVVLGARLDLRALGQQPSLIALAAEIVAFGVLVHAAAAFLTRQPPGAALAATAQLGVPAAVVTLGLQKGILTSGEGAAIVAAALVSLAMTAVGVTFLGRAAANTPAARIAETPPP